MAQLTAEQKRLSQLYSDILPEQCVYFGDKDKKPGDDTEEADIDVYKMDAKGTCREHPNYTHKLALEDAKLLRKAMKGLGCDKKALCQIVSTRNRVQRLMIKAQFKVVDSVLYSDVYGKNRDLIQDLKSETRGSFQKLICAAFMNCGEFEARTVLSSLATMDVFTFPKLLIEILSTRTNGQIMHMRQAWNTDLGRHETMENEIRFELKNSMKKDKHFKSLIYSLLQGQRAENCEGNANIINMRNDAKEMWNNLKCNPSSEQREIFKKKLVNMYALQSWDYICGFSKEFEGLCAKEKNKYTFTKAVETIFEIGSDMSESLILITTFCTNRYGYWAYALRKCMKGLGTDDATLIRVVIDRCEIDMFQIKLIFDDEYGDGKTFKKWIRDDTSGSYRRLLLLLCGYSSDTTFTSPVQCKECTAMKKEIAVLTKGNSAQTSVLNTEDISAEALRKMMGNIERLTESVSQLQKLQNNQQKVIDGLQHKLEKSNDAILECQSKMTGFGDITSDNQKSEGQNKDEAHKNNKILECENRIRQFEEESKLMQAKCEQLSKFLEPLTHIDITHMPQLSNGWRVCYTNAGKVFYANDVTQTTQWVHPQQSAQNRASETRAEQ